jgi:diguanylate cyclase (GGDEF)-like protein
MRFRQSKATGWSVRNRLVLLLLLPLSVVVVAVGLLASDRQAKSQAAEGVQAQVEGLRGLVGLQTALYGERAAVEIEFRSASFGVPSTVGAILLGIGDSESTFETTDAALRAADGGPEDFARLLVDARRILRSGDVQAIDSYEILDDLLVAEIIGLVETMHRAGLATAEPDLDVVLEQLEASVKVFSAATDQTTRLAGTWFGSPEERNRALSELGRATAAFELAIDEVELDRVPAELRSTAFGPNDPVSTAVVDALSGDLAEVGIQSVPVMVDVFAGSFTRNGALAELVDRAADDVETASARIADDAVDSYQMALALGLIAVLASILLSWRLATSIATPMLSVAERTRELRGGRIDPTPLPLSGPREMQDIAAALNEVSANLNSLETKLEALARADFSDPALHERLPGRLGDTLSKSVDTLSASLADRADLQVRLTYEASHDALTGLANRGAALERIDAALSRNPNASLGLLLIDLDDFKRVNDLFGHRTGDQVLIEVANRLVGSCRSDDLIARLGGDEFVVVLDGEAMPRATLDLARRIVDRLAEPQHDPATGGLVVAGAVGVVIATGGSIGSVELLAQADAALLRAKGSDARLAVFDDTLAAEVFQRAATEQRLRESLVLGEFEVHYQPIVATDSLEVAQVEALIRWSVPDATGPDQFIPVAEQSDLVVDLDRFVLHRATKEIAALIDSGAAPDVSLAVNVSGRHLVHAQFVDHVQQALTDSGLDPQRLIVEVTETALVADLERAALHLEGLRRLGVRVSVDDFGTGFTSISQLRRLPIDELKIDRSLVDQLPAEQSLVRVVQDLAAHFGMTTVAEGVEFREQADVLREIGCTQLQGWLFARAMPVTELRAWIDESLRVSAPDSP